MDLMSGASSLGNAFYALFYKAFGKSKTIESFITNPEIVKKRSRLSLGRWVDGC